MGEDRRQHIFQNGKDIVLGGKSHLHIQLIEFTGRTVAPGILIAETRCDLEIPVESGSHKKLLELLRCLRQRIEFAGMLPRRDQIVSCSFRRGSSKDGRGNLKKTVLDHGLAQRCDHIAP